MDDTEVRLRCLEVAARIARPEDRYESAIVEIATSFYNFANPTPDSELEPGAADKPKRLKVPKPRADILE